MHYPIKISKNAHDYSVSVKDLAGCEITAKTIEEGFVAIKKAIVSHLMILAEYGETIPEASSINIEEQPAEQLITWGIIEIDVTPFMGKSHKINVTLPELLIKKIDDKVSKSSDHKSRSGFIASACIKELNRT